MQIPVILIAILSALLFGAATPLSKNLLDHLSSFQLAGLLYIGAALGVLMLVIRDKKFTWPWHMDRKNAFRLLGAVLFGGMLGPVLLLAGLRLANAASVSMWLNLEMVATAILGDFIVDPDTGREIQLAVRRCHSAFCRFAGIADAGTTSSQTCA